MKLKLKNIGGGQPVVRIIRLTGETTLDNSENQFTVMDEAGMDFGIRLAAQPASMQYTKISTGEVVQLRLGDAITHPNQIDPDLDFDADWTEEEIDAYNERMADRKDIIIFNTVKTLGDATNNYYIFDSGYVNAGTVRIDAENIVGPVCVELPNVEVTIGSSVRTISKSGCVVQGDGDVSIFFEEGVEHIANMAFPVNTLKNPLVLPNSLTSVSGNIFPSDLTTPSITMGSGLTAIPTGFFTGCSTAEVIIPEGVTDIGSDAFGQNSIGKKVTLPSTLQYIESSAFMNWIIGEELIIPSAIEIMENAFFYWGNSLGKVDGQGGIEGVQSPYNLALPANLEFVDKGAFQGARFKELTINNPLTDSLGLASFGWCTAEKITLNGKVTNTNASFMNMELCTLIDLGSEGIVNIGPQTFQSIGKVTDLHIPGACRTIDQGAFVLMEELTNLTFAEGLEEFTDAQGSAFGGSYPNLEHLVFPNSLKRFNNLSAGNFSALKTMVFGNGLTKMGSLPSARDWDFKIFIGSPWIAGLSVPTFNYTPYLQVFVPATSFSQYAAVVNPAVLVPYTPPAVPAVVTLPPLEPIQTTEPWSLQWRRSDSATPEQTYFDNGIVPIDFLKDLPGFDDLIINCPIVANGALDTDGTSALKRIRILEGVVDLYSGVLSGMLIGVRELTLPSTLKGLGENVLTGAALLTSFTNNATSMDSVSLTALGDLPASLGVIAPILPAPPVITEASPTRFAGTGKRDDVIYYKITRGGTTLVDTSIAVSHDGTWYDNRAGEGYEVGDQMTAYYHDRLDNVSATATVATVTQPPQS